MDVIDHMEVAFEMTPEQRAKIEELERARESKREAEILKSHGRSAQLVEKYKPNRKQRRRQEAIARKIEGKQRTKKEKKNGR